MAKQLQLTIPTPCHEDWDKMTPVDKGKFCGSCQKQVVDFSNMSDRQVAEFFKKPSTGSVCGRFMTDQLDRSIEMPRKRIPWIKYFFQFVIPAFLVSIKSSAQKTQGQPLVKVATKDTAKRGGVFADQRIALGGVRSTNSKPVIVDSLISPLKKQPAETVEGYVKPVSVPEEPFCSMTVGGVSAISVEIPAFIWSNNKKEINGTVVNEKGEPVPFASIETNKEHRGVMADENGSFIIKRSWLRKDDALLVSSTGYEKEIVSVGKDDYATSELTVLLRSNVILPEVVVRAEVTGAVRRYVVGSATMIKGQTVAAVEKDSIISKENNLVAGVNGIFIYPNPVQAGSSFNIRFKEQEEGYYQLQFINVPGQPVQQKEIWIGAEMGSLTVNIPQVAAGTYFLVLTNKKSGKKYSEKIIIQ